MSGSFSEVGVGGCWPRQIMLGWFVFFQLSGKTLLTQTRGGHYQTNSLLYEWTESPWDRISFQTGDHASGKQTTRVCALMHLPGTCIPLYLYRLSFDPNQLRSHQCSTCNIQQLSYCWYLDRRALQSWMKIVNIIFIRVALARLLANLTLKLRRRQWSDVTYKQARSVE